MDGMAFALPPVLMQSVNMEMLLLIVISYKEQHLFTHFVWAKRLGANVLISN